MWRMIEQDILARYRPGKGRLRVCIVTDGEDARAWPAYIAYSILILRHCFYPIFCTQFRPAESPPEYRGVGGLSPMMRVLKNAGYDIEWFILLVGDSISSVDSRKYRSLAHATGGEFLALPPSGFNANGADERRFLDAMKTANKDSPLDQSVHSEGQQPLQLGDGRVTRQRRYEEDVRAGRSDKFDWYVALPHPTSQRKE